MSDTVVITSEEVWRKAIIRGAAAEAVMSTLLSAPLRPTILVWETPMLQ